MFATEVRGNSQRLDGGALFGNAPRTMWSKWHAPDELGRIDLACRALLLQGECGNVLLETGIGTFFPPEQRERYGVIEPEHVLLASLAALDVSHQDVNVVILSHLHFDHAGGLLGSYVANQALNLLFPNATYVVGATAFNRACSPHTRDRASFIAELPGLLQRSGRLCLVASEQRHIDLLGPAFEFSQTNGHTPGMLHTLVKGEQSSIYFCADLIPGRAWVRPSISMGYDRYPELLLDEKLEVLTRAAAEHQYLYFTHDPEVAMARVTKSTDGKYAVAEAVHTLTRLPL
jgi:glyoxylase-like metal-dependent hydrolase (beta-lactamase superfamily II)